MDERADGRTRVARSTDTAARWARNVARWARTVPQWARAVPQWAMAVGRTSVLAVGAAVTRLGRWVSGPGGRRVGLGFAIVAVTLAGIAGGLLVGGGTREDVGPFEARFSITPSLTGGTDVQLPPLGSVRVRSHDGPAHLSVDLAALNSARTRDLFTQPDAVNRASATAAEDLRRGVVRLALESTAVALLGAMVLAAAVFRSMRRVAICGLLALVVMGTSLAIAAGTFRRESIAEPTYEGLLVNARNVVGDANAIADRYDAYREQLQRMVVNVGRLYTTITTLPVYEPPDGTTKVLHISDMHLNPAAWSVVQTVVEQFDIDIVIDTGDITDWGSEPEASYVASIARLGVPYVFVRGNHDSSLTAEAVARQPNARVLDNAVTEVAGLTIAGIGDPRFTPDKTEQPPARRDSGDVQDLLASSGAKLAETIASRPAGSRPVDIAAVHDPSSAGPLAGVVPLVLAGHLHERAARDLAPTGPSPRVPRTQLLVEGSTGGAGLRGLEDGGAVPLQLSVLYLGPDRLLQAYDEISVGGTGQAEVTLQRRLVQPADGAATAPTPR